MVSPAFWTKSTAMFGFMTVSKFAGGVVADEPVARCVDAGDGGGAVVAARGVYPAKVEIATGVPDRNRADLRSPWR